MIALEVKFPVNPVSHRDEELLWTGTFYWRVGFPGLRVQVFTEYTAIDAFEVLKRP